MSDVPCPLAAMAAKHPNAVALRTGTGEYTSAQLEGMVQGREPRITPGEVVAVGCASAHRHPRESEDPSRASGSQSNAVDSRVRGNDGDGVGALVTLLSIIRAGGIALPLDPAFPGEYVLRICRDVGCKPPMEEYPAFDGRAVAPGPVTLPEDQPAVLVLTSGSTGTPKAALLSFGNLRESARLSNKNIPLAPGDAWLLSLPLFHVAGLGVLFRCLVAGATVALPAPGVTLSDALEGVTHVSLVAAQLHRLLEEESAVDRLRRMKAILLGGSAIPEGLLRDAHDAGLPIHTTYGLTEAASQVATTPPGADLDTLLTSGYPLHPESLRIDAEGWLLVGGPTRFLGYYHREGLERPFDRDGYFATGDLGRIDARGRLIVTGRSDNQFIAGGENIQPEEIERALCRLPGVRRAVVVPVPHGRFGNTPVAFVEGGGLTMERMMKALGEALPGYKIPRRIFPWPDDIAPAGSKIMRRPFIERARDLLR